MSAAASPPIERFLFAIGRRLGLQFDDSKRDSLLHLLQRRGEQTSLPVDHYLRILESGQAPPSEIRELVQQLTVGETYFFRNVEQFHALRDAVLPALARAASARPAVRILSAACATGEEPYSIAIVARELGDELPKPVEIVGIDINAAAIEKGRRARYSRWSLRGAPTAQVERWFQDDGRELRLDERIRRMVRFEERNLLDDDPILFGDARWDVIFCRNLLMYFTPEAASQLVERLTRALAPGGFLFLGYAETLRGLTRDFRLHHTHDTFYYERKTSSGADETPFTDAVAPLLAAEVERADSWVEAIGRASERVRKLADLSIADRKESAAGSIPGLDLSTAVDLLRRERYDDALSLVDALPRETAENPDVLTLRAVLLAHRGCLTAAEEACRSLLSIDDLNAGAHYLMALCREGAGDHAAALDHDQTAIHLDPGFAAPRLHLGLLERKAGRRFEARDHFARALVLLEREEPSRLLFFGAGFTRDALIAFCRAELIACGGGP